MKCFEKWTKQKKSTSLLGTKQSTALLQLFSYMECTTHYQKLKHDNKTCVANKSMKRRVSYKEKKSLRGLKQYSKEIRQMVAMLSLSLNEKNIQIQKKNNFYQF